MSDQAATNLASPEPSTTTRKSNKAPASASLVRSDDLLRRVHLVLQGKGGIGKTYVASLLGQSYLEAGRPVVCYDADPVNSSLTSFSGLSARPVKLFDGDQIDSAEIDRLMEDILTGSTDVVVDNGAAGFVPLSRYLIENEVAELLSEHGVQMVIHAVVAGGGMVMDTLGGLLSIFESYPPLVRVVIWVNEFFGPVEADSLELEQMPIYRDNRDRIIGVVRLERLSLASYANLMEMLKRKMTFAEAIAGSTFSIVPKQRLVLIRRAIFSQMQALNHG
jgi:hypothetical protein